MKTQHLLKTTADRKQLLRKVEDLDAFNDAEAQKMPSADRLEQIARVEVSAPDYFFALSMSTLSAYISVPVATILDGRAGRAHQKT